MSALYCFSGWVSSILYSNRMAIHRSRSSSPHRHHSYQFASLVAICHRYCQHSSSSWHHYQLCSSTWHHLNYYVIVFVLHVIVVVHHGCGVSVGVIIACVILVCLIVAIIAVFILEWFHIRRPAVGFKGRLPGRDPWIAWFVWSNGQILSSIDRQTVAPKYDTTIVCD